METVPALSSVDEEDEEEKEEGEHWRRTAAAITRKRSFNPFVTVEVSHKPSRVASPSSRWKTQHNRAPSAVGTTANPSPL
jgi:hypothetical protein